MTKLSITTYSRGGPKTWAEGLASHLPPEYQTTLYASRRDYLRCITSKHEILHTNVALPKVKTNRYILTIHGDYRREKLVGRLLFPAAIQRADLITVPSNYLKSALELPDAKVISNAIDIPSAGRSQYGCIGKSLTIGVVTNFDFREKADGVVQLARAVSAATPSAQLLVAGDGSFFQEFRTRISSVFPQTTYFGRCNTSEFLNRIDLFAYFSFRDNQPIAVLEAMAAGVPVISNAVGAVHEIMNMELSEFVFSSFPDYCDCLAELSNNPNSRESLGKKCRARSLDFSWANVTRSFSDLYSR